MQILITHGSLARTRVVQIGTAQVVAGAVMLAVLTAADDPQQCREAMASYNEMVAAVRAYEGACGRASGGTTAAPTTLSSR